jgi:hypothetical protein
MAPVRNFGAIQCHKSCVIQCACAKAVDCVSAHVTCDDYVVIFILFIGIKTRCAFEQYHLLGCDAS